MIAVLKQWWPWIERAIFIIVILLVVRAWSKANTAESALSKELEKRKIELAGLLVERDALKIEMTEQERKLLKENGGLREQVQHLTDVLGKKPEVVEVIRWRTKPAEAAPSAEPRPCPSPDESGKTKNVLFMEGDTGHAEAAEITYKTTEKNRVLVATIACLRDTPSSQLLFQSPIEAPLSSAIQTPEPQKKRWGAGGYVGSADSFSVGPSIAFPPFEVFDGQVEVTAGVGFGAHTQVGATGIYRWP